MKLSPADIEAIADAVVRKLCGQPEIDPERVAELPLAERRKFWQTERRKERLQKGRAA